MSQLISSFVKLVFIDFAILVGVFAVIFFSFVGIKAIKNGKNHLLTDENIIVYCARLFPGIIGKYLKDLLSWFFIFFVIHIFVSMFSSFAEYVRSVGTYDKNPLLAFFIDAVEAIIPVFAPFVIPTVVIIGIILIGYGVLATLHQLYKDEIEKDRFLQMISSVEENKASCSPDLSSSSDSLENTTTDNVPSEDEALQLELDSYLNSDSDDDLDPDFNKHTKVEDVKNKDTKNIDAKNIDAKKIPYKPTKKQIFFYFCENVQKAFFKVTKFLPKIIIVVAICVGINSLFLSIRNVTSIVENQKKIQELHMTIKNLSKSEGLARITLLKEERTGDTVYPLKTYMMEILDNNGEPLPAQTQKFTIRGNQIYIDAININFEYSEISQGEKYNIAYPYRVYSETMVPEKGIPLKCMYEDGKSYPVIYSLESSEIYGMKENVFFNRLAELFDTIKDDNLRKEMGIRSVVGVANHFTMKKNEIRDIFIEGTGGISVKKHETLFEDPSKSIRISLEKDTL